jgi:hypothetical protein
MKRFLKIVICFGFLLSVFVQTAYSHPLQTDHKANVTAVAPSVYIMPVFVFVQSTTVNVAAYVVHPVEVIQLAILREASQKAFILTNKQLRTRITEIKQYSSISGNMTRHVEKCQANYINQYNTDNQLNYNKYNPFS